MEQAQRLQKCTFPLMQSGTLELTSAARERLERLHLGIGVSIMEVLQLHQQQRPRPTGITTSVPVGATLLTPELEGLELPSTVARSAASDTGGGSNVVSDSDSDSGIDFAEEDAPLSSARSTSGDSESFSCSSRSSILVPGTDADATDPDQDDCDELSSAMATNLNLGTSGKPAYYASTPASKAVTWQRQRFAVLSFDQVRRLHDVMNEVVLIHGRGNFPTLELRLRDLVNVVRTKLEADSVVVKDIRLNGGAASYVLSSSGTARSNAAHDGQQQSYNDLDLIFGVDLSSARSYDRIKNAVLESLLDFLPAGVSRTRMLSCSLKEAYVSKMVKVTEGDRWSLISLGNHRGKNVELKFVHHMRRQFEFSVDSFQIILDSLLLFYDCAAMPIGETFYPTVVGESVYADFREALHHLHHKLIATRNPEEIRGGGLLKYCNLLVKEYQPANSSEIKTLERYMCSRFFIDFPDIHQQRCKLENYLWNHFIGTDEALKYDFLMILYSVVDDSTVCLMGHERRQTLTLIEELACQAYYADQQAAAIHQQQQAMAVTVSSAAAQQQNCNTSNAASSAGATHLTLSAPPPQHTFHHAPVYEVRISGCQPTVVYSSSGYFYAPLMAAHHHAPPPPPPNASNAGSSTVGATAAPPASAHTTATYATCHPNSCSCTCGWIACS